MSTRKLILWALVCGVLILVAGGAKLFQTTQQPVKVQLLELGESVTLGDMTVSVTSLRDIDDRTLVDVTMVGVAEAQAMDGWKLLAAGKVTDPMLLPLGAGAECTLTELKKHLYVPSRFLCPKARAPLPMFVQGNNDNGRLRLDA